MSLDILNKNALIAALMRADIYEPPVSECELIETHISWVIIAGDYAYKIKKPVNLGFLDFSTPEKRLHYCKEELRLNRRLAPSLYVSVMAITGTVEQPQWAEVKEGIEAIDFAVKMKAFPQNAQLDRMLENDQLQEKHIDKLARLVADFHRVVRLADQDSKYGDPAFVRQPVEQNFSQIRQHVSDKDILSMLDEIEKWCEYQYQILVPILTQRKKDGFIRECHGDLHLRNIAWLNEEPLVFDCIEFSENLRWIDVISEVAFLMMDLRYNKRPDLAQRFMNTYLEYTGDYEGVHVLQYYLVYRALVRAKVDAIRARQDDAVESERNDAVQDCISYLNLARAYIQPGRSKLVITHGMSGSGKSTVTGSLLEKLGAFRIRSDVERKRIYGLYPAVTGHADSTELYSARTTVNTYKRLLELADSILAAGYTVIVDAVFMNSDERKQFESLASAKQAEFVILDFILDENSLRTRISKREPGISDANLSVLEMQMEKWLPLDTEERNYAIVVNTETTVDVDWLASRINNS